MPSLCDYQIVAEFERILGVQTSVLDTFAHNFDQVVDVVLDIAGTRRHKNDDIARLLRLLQPETGIEDEGMSYTRGTVHHRIYH